MELKVLLLIFNLGRFLARLFQRKSQAILIARLLLLSSLLLSSYKKAHETIVSVAKWVVDIELLDPGNCGLEFHQGDLMPFQLAYRMSVVPQKVFLGLPPSVKGGKIAV